MRKFFLVSFVLCAMLALASAGFALEKTPVLDTANGPDSWTASSTCAIIYYNRCTLWSWAWSGWGPGDRVGVCADACCTGSVAQTAIRIFTGAPTGYGFTGTASIANVDANCCPTNTLASQPWLPTGPFDVHNWTQNVGSKFAVIYTYGPGAANPSNIGTDHPAAGPTGPQACGYCFPLDRANHSFYWGTAATPVCPGSVFNDGVCDAQLRLDLYMNCVVAVENDSWGSVKNLYR